MSNTLSKAKQYILIELNLATNERLPYAHFLKPKFPGTGL